MCLNLNGVMDVAVDVEVEVERCGFTVEVVNAAAS